jgi:hypothetical protein
MYIRQRIELNNCYIFRFIKLVLLVLLVMFRYEIEGVPIDMTLASVSSIIRIS